MTMKKVDDLTVNPLYRAYFDTVLFSQQNMKPLTSEDSRRCSVGCRTLRTSCKVTPTRHSTNDTIRSKINLPSTQLCVIASQYATSIVNRCWSGFPCKWRYINVETFNYTGSNRFRILLLVLSSRLQNLLTPPLFSNLSTGLE